VTPAGLSRRRSVCLDANFGCKESKNPLFATRGLREEDVVSKGYPAVRCHQAREDHAVLTRNLHSLHRKSGLDLPCPDT